MLRQSCKTSSFSARGNGLKLHQGKFRLGIRKHFFTERVVQPCKRLPRVVESLSLEILQKRVHMAPRDRFSGGIGSDILTVRPDNLKGFCNLNDSRILSSLVQRLC